MSEQTNARLIYMANQIARNFAAQGEEAAVKATAEHIRLFWDPRMKAAILQADKTALDSIARKAVELIAAECTEWKAPT